MSYNSIRGDFFLSACKQPGRKARTSFRLACKNFDPRTTHPVLFETSIICATVGLMVPAMSLIATFLYYPYNNGFQIYTALVQLLRLWIITKSETRDDISYDDNAILKIHHIAVPHSIALSMARSLTIFPREFPKRIQCDRIPAWKIWYR